MTNAPKTIFLTTGINDNEKVDFKDLLEVSWSTDKINEQDIEYINKEYVVSLLEAIKDDADLKDKLEQLIMNLEFGV